MMVWNLVSSHFIVTIVYNESGKQHIFLPSPENNDVWEYVGAQTPYSEKPSVVSIVLTIVWNQCLKQYIQILSSLMNVVWK